jgi:hypothetical protein
MVHQKATTVRERAITTIVSMKLRIRGHRWEILRMGYGAGEEWNTGFQDIGHCGIGIDQNG